MTQVLFIAYLFVCLVAAAMSFSRPALSLVLILIMFPMETILQSFQPILLTGYPWATNVAVAAVAVVSAGLILAKGEQPFRGTNNPVFWLLLTFYTLVVASTLWTPSPESAWFFLRQGWQYAVLLYLVAPLLLVNIRDLNSVVKMFMLFGAITLVFVLINPKLEVRGGRLVLDIVYVVGKGDFTTNPLALADLAATVALCAALFRPERSSFASMTLQGIAFVLGMYVAYLSGSRGQLVAAVGLIVVLWPMLKARASAGAMVTTLVASVVVAGLAASLYFFVFADLIGSGRWGSKVVAEGASDRFSFATGLIEGYASSPAFWLQGLGAGAFNAYVRVAAELAHYYPHNIAVEALAEYGVFGFVLLTAICVVTARSWFKLYRISGVDTHTRSLSVVLFGLTLFHFFMSLKQGATLLMPMLFCFCLVTAKLASRVESDAPAGGELPADDEFAPEDQAEIERAQAEYEAGGATA